MEEEEKKIERDFQNDEEKEASLKWSQLAASLS